MPLPEEPFETGRLFTPRVDRYGQIPVRINRYSVPIRLIEKRVRVVLHASHLLRPERGSRPARTADREGRRPLGPGPLPGSLGPQARRLPRLHRTRTGPLGRQVHPGPRRLVGPGPQVAW
ncbi:Mu transposase domain-containing protein [Streptomyces brevispora]|uniref:Mu transposase domain-containing protein n=1 Tax=Streptomyces brevispora TaxID=887462 RepID=UPI0039A44A40